MAIGLFSTFGVGLLVYVYFQNKNEALAEEKSLYQGFSWRMSIALNKEFIPLKDTLRNYHVLIKLNEPDFRNVNFGGKIVHKSSPDIAFSKSDGKTFLPSEIDYYNPATGEIHVWVLFDLLFQKDANNLFVYYGRPGGGMNNSSDLWGKEYKGVWHFTDRFYSKTSKVLSASNTGTYSINGLIGVGRKFNSESKHHASILNSADLDVEGDLSVSVWILSLIHI